MASKRLLKEWKKWTEEPPKNCVLLESTVPESKWMIEYTAPTSSLFQGGKFLISLEFDNYPFKAPVLTFITPIYHPNFSDKGEICQNVYEVDWAPTQKVTDVITAVDGTMFVIDQANPLRDEIAVVFRDNEAKFHKTKNEWIAKNNYKGK
jgi:ubiquitin-protein ligase